MNTAVSFRVTVSRIKNLLEELPKIMSVALRRFTIRASVRNTERHKDRNEIVEMRRKNHITVPETKKLVNDLQIFKEFACSRIDRTPREKRGAISRQCDLQERVKSAAVEIKTKRKSLHDTRLEFDKFVRKASAEIKINRSISLTVSAISSLSLYTPSTKHNTEEWESEVTSLKAEMALFDEMTERIRKINALREKDLTKLRLIAEKRCLAAVEKYDCQIGARHRLLAELTRDRNNLETEQDFAEERALEQGILYAQLKEEREVRLIAEFTRRLENFRRNRAANIIQVAWRSYYERSCAKRRRKTKRK